RRLSATNGFEPPSNAPKSKDARTAPPRDRDHPSDPDSAFPWPTDGATSATTPAATAAPNTHCLRFIRFSRRNERAERQPQPDDAPRRAQRQGRAALPRSAKVGA